MSSTWRRTCWMQILLNRMKYEEDGQFVFNEAILKSCYEKMIDQNPGVAPWQIANWTLSEAYEVQDALLPPHDPV